MVKSVKRHSDLHLKNSKLVYSGIPFIIIILVMLLVIGAISQYMLSLFSCLTSI